jgi:outer membrane protein assembly factor BamB
MKRFRFSSAAVTFLFAVGNVSGQAPGVVSDSAAMFRNDLHHMGVSGTSVGPALSGIKWTFRTRGPVRGSPVVSGDTVLVGSADGNLYALEFSSGRERWHTALGGSVQSAPAVSAGVVFVTNRQNGVAALELSTGKVRWRFQTGPDLPSPWGWDFWLSSPAVAAGKVYVGSGDGNVYALDASTGRQQWKAPTGGRVRSSPAVVDGTVYVGSMDGRLYALEAASGKARWTFDTEGHAIDSSKVGFDRTSIISSPAVTEERIFFGSRDAHLYAVDRRGTKQLWRFGHKLDDLEGAPEVSWVIGSPAVHDGLVFVGSSDGRFFNAVREESGQEVWRFKTPSNVLSSGTLAGGQIFFGCDDGHLFAIDEKTGEERWRLRAGAGIMSTPAVKDGVVLVGSDDGLVYAVATGPLRPEARPLRAVYWKDPGQKKFFKGDVAVRDYFQAEGYGVLDDAGLAKWLDDPALARATVLVVAGDLVPAETTAGAPEQSPLRRYLAAGGRVVWLGLPPDCFELDPKTGSRVRFDPSRTSRLLSVDHEKGSFDWMGATTTADGKRWGMPDWYMGGFAVPSDQVTTVLGLDEFGLASSWVKTFGGPAGSGFVRLWGREEAIPDLSWVQAVAEHME